MDEQPYPLKDKLEKQLKESAWLNKFKQLSFGLQEIKTTIPLTQLCRLQWLTDGDVLVIHCPNLEVREGLNQQSNQIARISIGAKYFVLRNQDDQDIIIKPAI